MLGFFTKEVILMKQDVWIDIDQETKQYDCEIHISGKDIFEIIDGISKVKDQIERDNGLNWTEL